MGMHCSPFVESREAGGSVNPRTVGTAMMALLSALLVQCGPSGAETTKSEGMPSPSPIAATPLLTPQPAEPSDKALGDV
jgi:hypothetical protein